MATNQQQPDVNTALGDIINRGAWRSQLATDYTDAATRLQTAYGRILPNLEASAGSLVGRINEWVQNNPNDSLIAEYVRGFKQYQDLLARVQVEMGDFATLLRNEAGIVQERAVVTGANGALELTQAVSGGAGNIIASVWNRPDPAALVRLVNYVDGDAFRATVNSFGVNAAQSVADTILASVAQGKGPRAISNILSNWFNLPAAWADNTVRTVQLYSYRTANHATYAANNDVLDGWVWVASLDDRCCISCISQHGTVHPLNETLNDHHRGRCTPVPLVKGSTWHRDMQTGPEWFDSRSPEQQRAQMGGAMFEAWKAGAVGWGNMSQRYNDPVYGEMLRAASLKGILGNDARGFYSRPGGGGNSGTVQTANGTLPRDIGRPGNTADSLNNFVNGSNGPLANAFRDSETALVYQDFMTDKWLVDTDNTRAAARNFVAESQNIQYSKDYLVSLAQQQAAANGVRVDSAGAEKLYNDFYRYRAQAIQTAADIGGVRLTPAQERRLGTAAQGSYLDMVYTTQSSLSGSLANQTKRAVKYGGNSYATEAAKNEARLNFLRAIGNID
jgi:hypothetical protein